MVAGIHCLPVENDISHYSVPANKPCKDLSIYRISGIKAKEAITDVPASISYNGEVVAWTGLNEQGNTRIEFDWQW